MRAFQSIFANTLRQLLGRRRSFGLLALSLLPAVIQLIVGIQGSEQDALDTYLEGSLPTFIAFTVPIVTIVLAASALGDERRGDTLPFLVLRPVPRTLIAAAKTAATWVAALAIGGLGAVATAAALGATTGVWDQVIPALGGTAVGALVYAGLFVPLGYVTSRAVVVGLAFLIIFEIVIASAVESLTTLSLYRIGLAAYAGLAGRGTFLGEPAGPSRVAFELGEQLGSVRAGFLGAGARGVVLALIGTLIITYLMRERDLV